MPKSVQLLHWIQIYKAYSRQVWYSVSSFLRMQDGLCCYQGIGRLSAHHPPALVDHAGMTRTSLWWMNSQWPRCWPIHGICRLLHIQLGPAAFQFYPLSAHSLFDLTKHSIGILWTWIRIRLRRSNALHSSKSLEFHSRVQRFSSHAYHIDSAWAVVLKLSWCICSWSHTISWSCSALWAWQLCLGNYDGIACIARSNWVVLASEGCIGWLCTLFLP